MALLAGLLIPLTLGMAALALANPPLIAQGTVAAFSNGAGLGVVTQLSQAAPDGVLIQTQEPVGASGDYTCQAAGATSWWYDPTPYASGAQYEYGQSAGSSEPAFASGTSFALSLPPEAPSSFSGVLAAGPQSCSQAVAFLVPVAGTYDLQFTADGGPLSFNVSPTQLAEQGANPITILNTVTFNQELTAGVWTVLLADTSTNTISWSISVGAAPPTMTNVQSSATLGYPGSAATFSLQISEPGMLDVNVLRGATVVRTLIRSQSISAGAQTITWDGKLGDGSLPQDGNYIIRATETDAQGRTVSQNFHYEIANGIPTANEASLIRAAVRQNWCNRVKSTGQLRSVACSAWDLNVARMRVDIFGRRYAIAANISPRLSGKRPQAGSRVLLKRVGSRWDVLTTFTSEVTVCSHPPISSSILSDLDLCA